MGTRMLNNVLKNSILVLQHFVHQKNIFGSRCQAELRIFHNIGKVKGNTSHTVVLKDHIGPVVSQNDLSFQNHFEG